jgi:hypothetical protein
MSADYPRTPAERSRVRTNNRKEGNIMPSTDTTGKTAQGRGKSGQFAKGNTWSKGPRRESSIARYKRWLDKSMRKPEFDAVARKVLEKAQAGDMAAARLILEYTVGPPAINAAEHLDLRAGLLELVAALGKKKRKRL